MYKIDKRSQTTKHSWYYNTCEYIILHHTGGTNNYENQLNYLWYSSAQVSCHYVVWQDWEIGQISDHGYVTWHAGESKYMGRTGFNKYSIGIEIVSNWHDYTDVQRDAVRWLVKKIMEQHNIQYDRVLTHKQISGYRWKWDVGDNFRNNKYDSYLDYQKSLMSGKQEIHNIDRLQMLHIMVRDSYQAVKAEPDADDQKTLDILANISNILREEGQTGF